MVTLFIITVFAFNGNEMDISKGVSLSSVKITNCFVIKYMSTQHVLQMKSAYETKSPHSTQFSFHRRTRPNSALVHLQVNLKSFVFLKRRIL